MNFGHEISEPCVQVKWLAYSMNFLRTSSLSTLGEIAKIQKNSKSKSKSLYQSKPTVSDKIGHIRTRQLNSIMILNKKIEAPLRTDVDMYDMMSTKLA